MPVCGSQCGTAGIFTVLVFHCLYASVSRVCLCCGVCVCEWCVPACLCSCVLNDSCVLFAVLDLCSIYLLDGPGTICSGAGVSGGKGVVKLVTLRCNLLCYGSMMKCYDASFIT